MAHAGGRPTKYDDTVPQKMMDYFDRESTVTKLVKFYDKQGNLTREEEKEIANTLPTIEGFCRELGISKSTLHEWIDKHEELSNAYKICKDIQLAIYQENSLKGLYTPIFAMFMGNNVFGWTNKTEVKSETTEITKLQDLSTEELYAELEKHGWSRKAE